MLSKDKRLNLKKQFNWVASGKKQELTNFKLFYRYGENSLPLVGIALAKKNFRKSTSRHKAKRLTSTAVQDLYSSLRKNLNLVIMPRSVILDAQVEDLKKELESVQDLR